jgi:hypothetical protein
LLNFLCSMCYDLVVSMRFSSDIKESIVKLFLILLNRKCRKHLTTRTPDPHKLICVKLRSFRDEFSYDLPLAIIEVPAVAISKKPITSSKLGIFPQMIHSIIPTNTTVVY